MATVAEPLVTPTETSHLCMARRQSLRLIRVPRYDRYGAGGRKLGEEVGQAVAFHEGILRIPKEGEVTLEDGRTADAGEIAGWLDGHRLLGDIEEGFWRVDPSAPPVSQDELRKLMDAALNYDTGTLEEIVRQEREGWNRAALIEEAENALVRIGEMKAQFEAEQAEQEQAAKKAPAKGGSS